MRLSLYYENVKTTHVRMYVRNLHFTNLCRPTLTSTLSFVFVMKTVQFFLRLHTTYLIYDKPNNCWR